ncbi:spermatogenesis-defective protein 39 homolog isoform 1-T1 [Synchiropus picturatus]
MKRSDEDEYWNSSKFKAFTFDDEDDDVSSQLQESRRTVNSLRQLVQEDEEDEVQKVSWSGEPVGSIAWSVQETASEGTFPKANADAAVISRSHSGYSLSSLFKGKARSFQSDSPVKVLGPELRRSKTEYKESVCEWSLDETVRRMQHGKPVYLERFRTLQDKLALLDAATGRHDGNIITAVLIYLKRTLDAEVLFRELEFRQTALRHFISHLTESQDEKLLLDLLRSLRRTEEAAMVHYRKHLRLTDEKKRRDLLKDCVSLGFGAEDSAHVQDQLDLLELQRVIEMSDQEAERGGKEEIFRKFPRKSALVNLPLITTLYYCCFYHYTQPEGSFCSPAHVRRTFKLSEKQHLVTALAARARQKAWSDVEAMLSPRKLFGFTRRKCPIGFHRVVDILHKNSAPAQMLQQYVALVEDSDLRIGLAQKHRCHDIVINTLKDLKDRQQLLAYRGKVDGGSAEEHKIDELLNNPQLRWKN